MRDNKSSPKYSGQDYRFQMVAYTPHRLHIFEYSIRNASENQTWCLKPTSLYHLLGKSFSKCDWFWMFLYIGESYKKYTSQIELF